MRCWAMMCLLAPCSRHVESISIFERPMSPTSVWFWHEGWCNVLIKFHSHSVDSMFSILTCKLFSSVMTSPQQHPSSFSPCDWQMESCTQESTSISWEQTLPSSVRWGSRQPWGLISTTPDGWTVMSPLTARAAPSFIFFHSSPSSSFLIYSSAL